MVSKKPGSGVPEQYRTRKDHEPPADIKYVQPSAQETQRMGVDMTKATKFMVDLHEIRDVFESWEAAFEHSTRDQLYDFVERLVQFAYKLGEDPSAMRALYLHRGVDMKKKYSNMWTPFVILVMGQFEDRTKYYNEFNKTTLKPNDYRFANVVRFFMDEEMKPTTIADYLKADGNSIDAVVKADKERYRNEEKEEERRQERHRGAAKAKPLATIKDVGAHFKEGYHEAIVRVVDGNLEVFGVKEPPKDDAGNVDLVKKQAAEERIIGYIAKHWSERNVEDGDHQIFASEDEMKAFDALLSATTSARASWDSDLIAEEPRTSH